jgi:hypothetical protein
MGKVQDDASEETWKICHCSKLLQPMQPKLKTPELGVFHEDSGEYDWRLCAMPLNEGTTSRFPVNRKAVL